MGSGRSGPDYYFLFEGIMSDACQGAAEIAASFERVKTEYNQICGMKLSLDLSRGKPGKEQLDLVSPLLSCLQDGEECIGPDGTDYRNYGLLDGIPGMKKIFSDLYGIPEDTIIIGGNSSLNLMYDTIARAMMFGVPGGKGPWGREDHVTFLCPSPGYDRHFLICETMGITMIPVPMTPTGPDMDEVERLCATDASVKGIWCVPKYSNPDGYTYSDETVHRLASMKTAAGDFRIFWDNAYGIHDIYGRGDTLSDIMEECRKAGNPERIYYFASTSKVTFPGAGVAMMAMCGENLKMTKKLLGVQTIGHDKVNQIRHVKYFGNADNVRALMKKQAEILRPKFALVDEKLSSGLGSTGFAKWTRPNGGYFVSLYVEQGCAKRVYDLCAGAGVKLTGAGAAFPYGKNPLDNHIRIAPTYPSIEDLGNALDCLVLCVKYASLEKRMAK